MRCYLSGCTEDTPCGTCVHATSRRSSLLGAFSEPAQGPAHAAVLRQLKKDAAKTSAVYFDLRQRQTFLALLPGFIARELDEKRATALGDASIHDAARAADRYALQAERALANEPPAHARASDAQDHRDDERARWLRILSEELRDCGESERQRRLAFEDVMRWLQQNHR